MLIAKDIFASLLMVVNSLIGGLYLVLPRWWSIWHIRKLHFIRTEMTTACFPLMKSTLQSSARRSPDTVAAIEHFSAIRQPIVPFY